jgi:hypothetical protein
MTLFGEAPRADQTGVASWDVGAAVLRSAPGGWIYLELGPADGRAQVRLTLSPDDAHRLAAGLRRVNQEGGEAVVMA